MKRPKEWYLELDDGYEMLTTPELLAWHVAHRVEHERQRHVGDDVINGLRVLTQFLFLDCGGQPGRPLLYETRVLEGTIGELACRRYCSRAQAIAGHAEFVSQVRRGELDAARRGGGA